MLRDFRIGWRLLLQRPLYSLVIIGGLAIGFASCFLLFGFVQFCLNYNGSVPDNHRVVVIKQRINVFPRAEWQLMAFLPLRDVARASGMVEASTIVKALDMPLRTGDALHALNLQLVDADFQSMFAVVTLEGELHAALTQPDGLALTVTAARKLFGASSASILGRTVDVAGSVLQVRALLRDPAPNSSPRYEALAGAGGSAWRGSEAAMRQWDRGGVYLKLKPGASISALTALLQQASEKAPLSQQMRSTTASIPSGGNVSDLRLLPLRDVYFDADLARSQTADQYAQRSSIYALAAGGLFILLLATINYVNLATVRTLRRQREIGIRKLLGASAWRLTRQFLCEAVLTTVLAAGSGLVLAWLLLPVFAGLVDRPLEGIFTPFACALALGFSVAIGLCAGAYPAWLAHHALPGPALAGRGDAETAAGLRGRRVLTVVQFASALALSATTLAVSWQTYFLSHASPGFDPAGLLVLNLPSYAGGKSNDAAFVEQLRRLPRVQGLTSISEAVGRDGAKSIHRLKAKDGSDVPMEAKFVGPEWFELHHLHAAFGEAFNTRHDANDDQTSGRAMVNAAGALALGYATPQEAVGKMLSTDYRIIGIAPEVRFQELRKPSRAIVYFVRHASVLVIRTDDQLQAAHDNIAPLWRRHYPNDILDLRTQQMVLAERLLGDRRLMRILAASSAIALALSGFGIFVLSAYSVQRRQREIVMRKLHGASRLDIALMMAREFGALFAISALLGLPPAWLAIQHYLASHAERAPMSAWPLLAALALGMAMAVLAIAHHTLGALRLSPARMLRD